MEVSARQRSFPTHTFSSAQAPLTCSLELMSRDLEMSSGIQVGTWEVSDRPLLSVCSEGSATGPPGWPAALFISLSLNFLSLQRDLPHYLSQKQELVNDASDTKSNLCRLGSEQVSCKCGLLPVVCPLLGQGLGAGPGDELWTQPYNLPPICKMSWVKDTFCMSLWVLHLGVLSGQC